MSFIVLSGSPISAGEGVQLPARIVGLVDGTPITAASLTSIGYTVTDMDTAAVVATGTFTISTVILASLVTTDYRWTFDSQFAPGPDNLYGYNFLAVLPSSTFPLATPSAVPPGYPVQPAAKRYQVIVLFTPVTGQAFKQEWRITVKPTFG